MPERTVTARLVADIGRYKGPLLDATSVTRDLAKEVERTGSLASQKAAEQAKAAHLAEQAQQRQFASAEKLGRGMLIAGAGIAAGIGLATRAAINWESAWAGVVKTVDGSEAQLAELENGLRSMARELPATHAEIAAVAEAAGQLGIKVEDVEDFTRTMINMGVATNLTAEEAAVAIAQMANVMGTATSDVDNLGSTIVDLGNNSATTEADIVAMAQRIAGAGATIGLTEADVLGFSAALASVGINAEAGGSAISRAMISIESAVRDGGKQLDALARVAGMSADQFSQAYERDAARAIATFIAGLGRMKASGENVFAVLDELGFSEIRLRDALLRLASSGDLLTRSLDIGAEAWGENIALTEEAERRYGTAASRIQIAQNQLNDFAIEMGATFLPMVASGADALGNFVGFLGGLPGPLQSVIGVTAALTGAILLLGGTALIAVPKIVAYKAALATLQATGSGTATALGRLNSTMGRVAGVAGGVAAAFAALQIVSIALEGVLDNDLEPQIDALVAGLDRWATEGKLAGEAARIMGDDAGHLRAALRRLGDEGGLESTNRALHKFWESMIPALDGVERSVGEAEDRLEALDAALAQMHTGGNAAEAAAAFERIKDAAEEVGIPTERLMELFPEYGAALEVAAREQEKTGDGMGEMGDAAAQAAEDVDALKEAFDALFGVQMDIDRATIAYHQGLQDLTEAIAGASDSLDAQTQAGRDNQSAILDQVEAIADLRAANIDNGKSIEEANEIYVDQLGQLEDLLIQQGFNEDAVRDLIDSYRDIPGDVSTSVKQPGMDAAQRGAKNLKKFVDDIPKERHTKIAAPGLKGVAQTVNNFIEALRNIPSRRDTRIHTSYTESGPRPVGGRSTPVRWGGVFVNADGGLYTAQSGLLRRAAIFPPQGPARFAFAEPETGGEAFIPRLGDRTRSLAIADVAARWHGGRVVAGGGDGAAAMLGQAQRFSMGQTPVVNVQVVAQPASGAGAELMDQIVRSVRYTVRTEGGGSVQAALGQGR